MRKPKSIPISKLSTLRMGCGGKGKPEYVIDKGRLMHYVGIGWITVRDATREDRRQYPEVRR